MTCNGPLDDAISRGKKYCSSRCRSSNSDGSSKYYKPRTYDKVCPLCGVEFVARRKDKKYCTATCRGRAEFERNREQRREQNNDWNANNRDAYNSRNRKAYEARKESKVCSDCGGRWLGVSKTKCPWCNPSGYKESKPGVFYILEHVKDRTVKGGITNQGTSRIDVLVNAGFSVAFTFVHADGKLIRQVENEFHRHCKAVGLARYYTKETMPGKVGGHTEAYSLVGTSTSQLVAAAKAIISKTDPNL